METIITVPDNQATGTLKNLLQGEVILPEDTGYDNARKVYNAMIDKRPAIIAKCMDVADVIHAVNFGRENGMLTAVRGGGHNGAGLGICEDGLVIDLSGIKYVRVDSNNRTVRVGGGSLWGEVDHATHAYGLAVPSGIISTTGVGGLTLGGGTGHLSRKYGLTIDNLLEADMVLADGSFVTVNENQNSDLFWAIRGGGGNFGIVTSFLFKAHPVHTVVGGVTLWPIEETERVMEWYHDFLLNAPEELNGFIATMVVPGPPFPDDLHNEKFCGIVWCYAGDLSKTDSVFEPVRNMQPLFEHLGAMPFPALQSMFDDMMVPGMQWYWRGDFFGDLNDEAAAIHRKFGTDIPTPLSQMHLYPISGAAARVDNSATPWAYREATYSMVIIGVDPDPGNAEIITRWTRDYWEALHPLSSGGGYTNFLMEENSDRVKASYRENYDRLVKIKRKFDPENFFRVNQNIKP
jgi:FAD/FMN-containing dehydrogenase